MSKRFSLSVCAIIFLIVFSVNQQETLAQLSCSPYTTFSFDRNSPVNLDVTTPDFDLCFNIINILSSVLMLQLETKLEQGSFDAYYQAPGAQTDWIPLTLERAEGQNLFEFLPFTFGQNWLEVGIHYYTATTVSMNIGFTDFESSQPTPEPSGSASSGGLTSIPAEITIRTVELQRFYDYRIPLTINCPGVVSATVTFNGGSRATLIILKGDGRQTLYDQANGSSPVNFSYAITADNMRESKFFQLSLQNWDSNAARNVTVQINTPDCPRVGPGVGVPSAPGGQVVAGGNNTPSGSISNVWVEHNVYSDTGDYGMRIHVELSNLCNAGGLPMATWAYFYFANGDAIPSSDQAYMADGFVAAGSGLTPDTSVSCLPSAEMVIFISYQQLELEPYRSSMGDSFSLRFYVRTYVAAPYQELDRSDWVYFTYTFG